jgi:thymidine kinase
LKFSEKNRDGQHGLLVDESDLYMDALLDVVKNLNSNRELMEFVLPTIDAIYTYEPGVLR